MTMNMEDRLKEKMDRIPISDQLDRVIQDSIQKAQNVPPKKSSNGYVRRTIAAAAAVAVLCGGSALVYQRMHVSQSVKIADSKKDTSLLENREASSLQSSAESNLQNDTSADVPSSNNDEQKKERIKKPSTQIEKGPTEKSVKTKEKPSTEDSKLPVVAQNKSAQKEGKHSEIEILPKESSALKNTEEKVPEEDKATHDTYLYAPADTGEAEESSDVSKATTAANTNDESSNDTVVSADNDSSETSSSVTSSSAEESTESPSYASGGSASCNPSYDAIQNNNVCYQCTINVDLAKAANIEEEIDSYQTVLKTYASDTEKSYSFQRSGTTITITLLIKDTSMLSEIRSFLNSKGFAYSMDSVALSI